VSLFENCVYVCWNLYESTRMVHHEGDSESARKIYKIYPTDHFRRLYKLIGSAFFFFSWASSFWRNRLHVFAIEILHASRSGFCPVEERHIACVHLRETKSNRLPEACLSSLLLLL
jgi:hypothetical protein